MFSQKCHPANMPNKPKTRAHNSEELRPSSTLLLLSNDQALADLVREIVKPPWALVHHDAERFQIRKMFSQPNVRLVLLDDQTVDEDHRSWLLAQISKHFSGSPLLYVAGHHTDGNEKRARTNGAQYYVSKPLEPERFGEVLRSFLQVQLIKG